MSAPRYRIMPGYVQSKHDGDVHWIGANQLIDLYGVKRDECVIGSAPGDHRQLMRLHPDRGGRYRHPDTGG